MTDEETYNALRKEATESNYYNSEAVGKDTLLYKFVAQQAKDMGASIDNISVTFDNKDRQHSSIIIDPITNNNILVLDPDSLSGNSNIAALRGTIKHELGHSKQNGYSIAANHFLLAFGINSPAKKMECEADFIAGKDTVDSISRTAINHTPQHYFGATSSHPAHRQRLQASLIKSYIEENSGVVLNPEDVNIGSDCSFTITNKEKLKDIPLDVIKGAPQNAQSVLANIDQEVMGKIAAAIEKQNVSIRNLQNAPIKPAQLANLANGR